MLLHFSNSFESERIDIDPFPSSRRYYTRGLKGNGKVIKREEERGAGKNSETTRFDSLSPSQTLFFFFIRVENPPSIHAYRFFFLFPSTKALLMLALTPRDPCWPFFSLFHDPSFLRLSLPFFSPLFHPFPLFSFSSLSLSLSLASTA